ncbi:fasciclin domain-containing protein [Leucobacter massiliensis]|uniref:Fasciclin n=1 Tax=Leucobacter massiliensis TaxID=1686285 RepID=A0A2S9QN31_9MICO|nr:fasciclin domain-containing protein [Leucobacter massiliensis]PRI10998.1 fasciclin [Leucobacter massiliensis]
MFTTKKTIGTVFAATLIGAAALTGCSMDASNDEAQEPQQSQESMPESNDTMDGMDPAANLVGPGCDAYAEAVPEGAGSIQGMSQDPVAVAASNNPMLTTLVSAVSGELNPDVNLVDTLNGGEFTVFAPVDDAFGKIDAATIDTLKTDSDLLTSILTYHVVPGQIEPDDIDGSHKTVEGQELEVTGSGDDLKVNGVNVVCGGVQTANAVVYLVDGVLMPPSTEQ